MEYDSTGASDVSDEFGERAASKGPDGFTKGESTWWICRSAVAVAAERCSLAEGGRRPEYSVGR